MKSFFAIALLLCVVVAVVSAEGETGGVDLSQLLNDLLQGVVQLLANLLKPLLGEEAATAVEGLKGPLSDLVDSVLGDALKSVKLPV